MFTLNLRLLLPPLLSLLFHSVLLFAVEST